MIPPTWYFAIISAAVRTPISARLASMSAWSGSVAECPYTRITKSCPTFSSRLIREMRPLRRLVAAAEFCCPLLCPLLADRWAATAPGATTPPVTAAAAVAAVAVRRVRLEVRWCT